MKSKTHVPFEAGFAAENITPQRGIALAGYFNPRPNTGVRDPLQVKAALRLIAEFSRSPMAGLVDLRWIDLGAPAVMVVTTGTGSKITFGTERLDLQLRRWHSAYEYARQHGQAVASGICRGVVPCNEPGQPSGTGVSKSRGL